MQNIFAPWRMEYIDNIKESGCFLCNAVAENNDDEKLILFRADKNFVIMNKYPYNNGHLMIVPFRHIGVFEELTDEELSEIMVLTKKMKKVLDKTMNPNGYNIGINLGLTAGAGLAEHIHLHIVPRWNGDTNFMPVIADTKVMPEYLKDTYKKIKNNC